MGQVARHKAAKASARAGITEPAYRTRRRERALERARRRVMQRCEALVSDFTAQLHRAIGFPPGYAALLDRVHAHNVAAGVYGPGHSGALH